MDNGILSKYKLQKQKLINDFMELHKKSILEVGCGYGFFTEILLTGDNSIVAIDPDIIDIDGAINSLPQVKFVVCSLQDFKSNGQKFDLVIFSKSFHELEGISHEEAIKIAKSLLEIEGKILIIEQSLDCEFTRIYDYIFSGSEINYEQSKIQQAQDFIKTLVPKPTSCIINPGMTFNSVKGYLQAVTPEIPIHPASLELTRKTIKLITKNDPNNGKFTVREAIVLSKI